MTLVEHAMLKHTVQQDAVNPTNSLLPKTTDNHLPDDDYIRMLRFYLQTNRWVEEQISAELEVEIASELQDLGKKPEDWGW